MPAQKRPRRGPHTTKGGGSSKKRVTADPQGDRKAQDVSPEELKSKFEIFADADDECFDAECLACRQGCTNNPEDLLAHLKDCCGTGEPPDSNHQYHFDWKEEGKSLPRGYCRHCRSPMSIGATQKKLKLHLMHCESDKLNNTWYKGGTSPCADCNEEIAKSEISAHDKICPEVKVPCFACRRKIPRRALDGHRSRGECQTWPCPKCKTSFPATEKEDHQKSCDYQRCSGCGKYFPSAELGEHKETCGMFHCTDCQKKYPVEDREKHKGECPRWKCHNCMTYFERAVEDSHRLKCALSTVRCHRCGRPMPLADWEEHQKKCPKWRCSKCGQIFDVSQEKAHRESCGHIQCHNCSSRMKISEKPAHDKECPRWACPGCFRRMPKSEETRHREQCQYRRCCKCDLKFTKEVFTEHFENCLWCRCPRCGEKILAETKAEHLALCKTRVCLGCCQRGIPRDQWPEHKANCEYGWCGQCARGKIRDIKKHKAECTACWTCHEPDSGPGSGHECAFARCPNCSRRQRFENLIPHMLTCKFFKCKDCKLTFPDQEAQDSHECLGYSTDNLAVYKRKPRTGPGRRPIDWLSGTFPTTRLVSEIDLEYVAGSANSLGEFATFEIAIDLLPPKPVRWARRPLCWWGNVKALLRDKAAGQSLALGVLYQDIFPERLDRAKNWHHAGTDVEMTIALINTYFTRAQGKPLEGKIDAYFPPIPLPAEDAKLLVDDLSKEQREEVLGEDVEGPEEVDYEDDIDSEDEEWNDMIAAANVHSEE